MSKIRILVVEDERIIANDIKETLQGFGYAVVATADSGELAIKQAEEHKPDIILMDVMLKGKMNGIEAASKIKEKMDVPIIYLTSYSDSESIEKAKITEPFGYILKPFSEKELHTTIEMAIYKHHAELKIKDSEKKYRDLYENAPEGLISTNKDWRIFESNRKYSEMLGYSRDDLNNSIITEYLKPGELENFKKAVLKFNQKGHIINFETKMLRKSGEEISVILNSTAVFDDENNMTIRTSIKDVSELKMLEEENLILSDKIVKLSKKIVLTDNEKNVLAGIINNPLMNDVELSKSTKIKRSTVTAIKNKLLREGYYSNIRIPNFSVLGCELFTVVVAEMHTINVKKENKDDFLKKLNSCNEIFYVSATNKNVVALSVSKNFTIFRTEINNIFNSYEDVVKEHNYIHFHYELSTIDNLFDFSRLICNLFDISIPAKTQAKKFKPRKLTENEKSIFYYLVKYPGMNDSEIADETKIPRPSISQTRKRLLNDGYLAIVNVPDILKIKHELLSFNHSIMDKEINSECLRKAASYTKSLSSTVFMVSQENEFFSMSLFDDYSELDKAHADKMKHFADNKCHLKKETNYLLPVTQLKFSKLNFAPLLKSVLNLPNKNK